MQRRSVAELGLFAGTGWQGDPIGVDRGAEGPVNWHPPGWPHQSCTLPLILLREGEGDGKCKFSFTFSYIFGRKITEGGQNFKNAQSAPA